MTQPEALRLAEALNAYSDMNSVAERAVAELRRQHTLIERMREALELLLDAPASGVVDHYEIERRARVAIAASKEEA